MLTKRDMAASLGLTEPELNQIGKAAYKTYQLIGPDLRNEGEPLHTKDEIVEIVLDADHIITNCGDMLTGKERRALRHVNRQRTPDPLAVYLKAYVFTASEYE